MKLDKKIKPCLPFLTLRLLFTVKLPNRFCRQGAKNAPPVGYRFFEIRFIAGRGFTNMKKVLNKSARIWYTPDFDSKSGSTR